MPPDLIQQYRSENQCRHQRKDGQVAAGLEVSFTDVPNLVLNDALADQDRQLPVRALYRDVIKGLLGID